MSAVVVVATLTFVAVVVALAVTLRRLRRTLELEEVERVLEERFGQAGLGACKRP